MRKIKKSIYPKTTRVKDEAVVVTEKLDGSNLTLLKRDGELWVATRNYVFPASEVETEGAYRGLKGWLDEYGKTLKDNMHETSAICGEWMGSGQTKYGKDAFEHKFYMFAKANVSEELELFNIYYNRSLFIYPFIDQTIPEFIGVAPKVKELQSYPSIEQLDELYDSYTESVDRKVEGFIIILNNNITKYVRMKGNKLQDHFF